MFIFERFHALAAENMKTTAFWNIALCSLAEVDQRFIDVSIIRTSTASKFSLIMKAVYTSKRRSTSTRYTALYPRRLSSSNVYLLAKYSLSCHLTDLVVTISYWDITGLHLGPEPEQSDQSFLWFSSVCPHKLWNNLIKVTILLSHPFQFITNSHVTTIQCFIPYTVDKT
jgi:hypothetical protein